MAGLAAIIKINANTFRTYVNQQSFPTDNNLLKIAEYFGLSMEEMYQVLLKKQSPQADGSLFDKIDAEIKKADDPASLERIINSAASRLKEIAGEYRV